MNSILKLIIQLSFENIYRLFVTKSKLKYIYLYIKDI